MEKNPNPTPVRLIKISNVMTQPHATSIADSQEQTYSSNDLGSYQVSTETQPTPETFRMPVRIHFGYSSDSESDPTWARRKIYGDMVLSDSSLRLDGVDEEDEVCSAMAEGTKEHALPVAGHDTFKGTAVDCSDCELFGGENCLRSTTSKDSAELVCSEGTAYS